MFVVVTVVMLAAAMAGGLAMASHAERLIAAAHRRTVQMGYVAESATERVVSAIEAQADWHAVPGTFTDGSVVLTAERVARTATLNRSLRARFLLGLDTPVWRVIATSVVGDYAITVWVADDPAERDGDPAQDGNGRLMVRSEVRMAMGAVRTVTVHLARVDGVNRRLSWQEEW